VFWFEFVSSVAFMVKVYVVSGFNPMTLKLSWFGAVVIMSCSVLLSDVLNILNPVSSSELSTQFSVIECEDSSLKVRFDGAFGAANAKAGNKVIISFFIFSPNNFNK
jgi:hypothetical protein